MLSTEQIRGVSVTHEQTSRGGEEGGTQAGPCQVCAVGAARRLPRRHHCTPEQESETVSLLMGAPASGASPRLVPRRSASKGSLPLRPEGTHEPVSQPPSRARTAE
jgi:hypothetical protein